MNTVAELFERLQGDAQRKTHPFSTDILEANALLHNLAAFEDEMAECLTQWCLMRQPCQFGRAAAKDRRIHFCFLRDEAVSRWSDDEIAAKISEERKLWKQRAAFDTQRAAHSFVLVVASPRVALSAPDTNLQAFAERILQLTGWANARRGGHRQNTISSDYLYLRSPNDGRLYGFQFNIDFFGCAGDKRWWHDHRFPGGIAFTSNSTGHMRCFREWYGGAKGSGKEWAVKQAMLTIKNAAPTRMLDAADAVTGTSDDPIAEGRVTWLRPLEPGGKPLVADVACPLTKVPSSLEGKDWTRYEGLLHTDHAVREEFFQDRDFAPTVSKPYLMDFTYLYHESQPDFMQLTGGKPFTEDDIYSEIGRPEDWTHRKLPKPTPARSDELAAVVAEQLALCHGWQQAPWYAGLDE